MRADETSRITVAIAMEDYTGSEAEVSNDGSHRILAFVNLNQRSAEPYSLASVEAAMTNTDGSLTFVGRFFERMKQWLASTASGIDMIVARVFVAKDIHSQRICLGTEGDETCITKTELDQLLLGRVAAPSPEVTAPVESTPPPPVLDEPAINTNDIPVSDTEASSQ
jgi:hypothetical protein